MTNDNDASEELTPQQQQLAAAATSADNATAAFTRSIELTAKSVIGDIDLMIAQAERLKASIAEDQTTIIAAVSGVLQRLHAALKRTHDFHGRLNELATEWQAIANRHGEDR